MSKRLGKWKLHYGWYPKKQGRMRQDFIIKNFKSEKGARAAFGWFKFWLEKSGNIIVLANLYPPESEDPIKLDF